MSITSTLVTDDWRYIDIGDFGDATEDLIKKGLSGTATFTPVGLTGVSVDDTPEDWYVVARPRTARYTLGRLVGGDGVKGIRLVSSVDGNPVVWRVERELRWNGQTIPGIDPVTVIFSGEANHLPEMSPVAGDSGTSITEAVVAVSQLIIAAQQAAGRAESAATTALDANEDVQDAAARAQAGAERVGTAEAVLDAAARADQSAEDADAAAVRSETSALSSANYASSARAERNSAKNEADRAQAAADSVDTDAIRQEVTDQIAAVVDGAPADLDTIREVAEAAQENRDITDTLNAAIGQKADKVHTHAVADVTGLQAALDGKAASSHTHTMAQVTGLQAALDGKAASSHTHTMAQVTGLDAALSAKLDASKIQVVSTVPTTPVAGTVYYVTGV